MIAKNKLYTILALPVLAAGLLLGGSVNSYASYDKNYDDGYKHQSYSYHCDRDPAHFNGRDGDPAHNRKTMKGCEDVKPYCDTDPAHYYGHDRDPAHHRKMLDCVVKYNWDYKYQDKHDSSYDSNYDEQSYDEGNYDHGDYNYDDENYDDGCDK
jgi:hypothetical protein